MLACRIPTDRRSWQATVHGVTQSRTQLSDEPQHRGISIMLYMVTVTSVKEKAAVIKWHFRVNFIKKKQMNVPRTPQVLECSKENREREPGGDDDQVYYYYNNITMILEPGLPCIGYFLRAKNCDGCFTYGNLVFNLVSQYGTHA